MRLLLLLCYSLLLQPVFGQITFEQAFPNLRFSRPVEIQNANDGNDRLFVVEQQGLIKVFPNESGINSSSVINFLDLEETVTFSSGQEMGLLGLAFHPNYTQNGYFYVYYTTGRSNNLRMITSRFSVDSLNPNIADPDSEVILLEFEKNQPNSNHNGGKIAFGIDGYLYISIGDGGGGNDPRNNAQNINNAFGTILRIDVDLDGNNPLAANGQYEIPADNIFVGREGLDEIFAYGIRNTWKFSVDEVTGNIWGADVGQSEFEEINLIVNGANYGWKRFEAEDVANNSAIEGPGPLTFPVYYYQHTTSDRSITGGVVYRGSEIESLNPSINSKYIFADYVSGRVWALDYNSTTQEASRVLLFDSPTLISSFGKDESGEIYFSAYDPAAQIYKLVDGTSAPVGMPVDGIGEWAFTTTEAINGEIRAMETTDQGIIYIGGNFSVAEDASINNIASWSQNDGLRSLGAISGTINSIKQATNGNLFVAGSFSEIDGVAANNIAMWNGTSWSNLGNGINGSVAAMAIDADNRVYVGGIFDTLAGNTVRNIALWDGTNWNALVDNTFGLAGTNNEVRSLAIDTDGILYAGGNFDEAGGNFANRIASWDGNNWSALGNGTSGFVEAIATTENAVYAGGNFAEAGNLTVNRIAKWDKSSGSWSALGNGLSNIVTALIHDGDYLYAAGGFKVAYQNVTDAIIVNSIVQYNDSTGWTPLGTNTSVGVDNQINTIQFARDSDGPNKIYVGGNFNAAGLISARDFAVWNNDAVSNDETGMDKETIIYPNPTDDKVFLTRTADYILLDNQGRTLMSGYGKELDLSNLSPGSYFLKLESARSFVLIKK